MVLHKRSDYGFHGYQIPTMPRGCRSARRKRPARYDANAAELCAIDLLATVAGRLLLEKEVTSPRPGLALAVKAEEEEGEASRVALPLLGGGKPAVKVEPCDQGSCDEGAAAPVVRCQKLSHKHAFKETTNSQASTSKAVAVSVSRPAISRHYTPAPAANGDEVAAAGTPIRSSTHPPINCIEHDIATSAPSGHCNGKATAEGDPMDVDATPSPPPPPLLASSDSSVEVPAARGYIPRSSSIPRFMGTTQPSAAVDHDRAGHEEGGDEDDGNSSSACTQPSSVSPKAAAAFRPQRIGDRRIRKLLSSRFWKLGHAPAPLKDGEFYDRDMFRSKKLCYTRQKSQKSCFKRKKLLERSSVSSSSAGIAAETISKLSSDYNKCVKGEPGNGTSSSITSHRSSFKSEDYKVKLKIKSFKVPELLIEMPEAATVGSLKRAVLETVTAMLGNGLKVGVIYQGRKVRDDSRTLVQAGITGAGDSLNFSLEPTSSAGGCLSAPAQIPRGASPASCRADPLPLEQCRSPRPLSARLPALPQIRPDAANKITSTLEQQQLQTKALGLASPTGSDSSGKAGAVHAYANANASPITITDASASGAIVPVSSTSTALVPVNPPTSSSELPLALVPKATRRPETATAQRRIRRPFSVAEVEALVQAVEKLGTGRWRDVKLQAFENAKHRTYVDLKDKWKTLVHTARISPQQRRGEPVPQDLLDRVLVAHAHWSQHQARLQSSKQAAGASTAHDQQPSCGLFLPPPPSQPEQLPQPLALPPPPAAAAAMI